MAKFYLNRDVFYKSKDTFSCIYHSVTGWYYPCRIEFWESLQSYRGGREIDPAKLTPDLSELIRNRFLIQKKTAGPGDYLDFYPFRAPDTVYYQNVDALDVLLDAANLGDWVLHCHIAEHLLSGMVTMLSVSE